jgi:ribosomal protein L21E
VQLNPRRTRIANLKWLLPICVQQFGTTISMREHTEGDRVVLTITATASSRKTVSRPAGRGGQVEVAAGELVVAA